MPDWLKPGGTVGHCWPTDNEDSALLSLSACSVVSTQLHNRATSWKIVNNTGEGEKLHKSLLGCLPGPNQMKEQ